MGAYVIKGLASLNDSTTGAPVALRAANGKEYMLPGVTPTVNNNNVRRYASGLYDPTTSELVGFINDLGNEIVFPQPLVEAPSSLTSNTYEGEAYVLQHGDTAQIVGFLGINGREYDVSIFGIVAGSNYVALSDGGLRMLINEVGQVLIFGPSQAPQAMALTALNGRLLINQSGTPLTL